MIINFIRYLKRKHKKTEISLNQLSSLWTNADQKKAKTAQEDSENTVADLWANPKLKKFYKIYIQPYKNNLGDALESILKIMTLLDKAGNYPSVAENDPTETTDLKFSEITLVEHTLNVAGKVLDAIKDKIKDHELLAGEMLIVSLAHNLGKLPGQDMPVDLPSKSAIVAEHFLKNLPFKKTAMQTIKTYKNSPRLKQAKILSMADHAARKMEEAILEN
ncbi:hypothetical protein BuS5_03976 (plasmid) [Desulfosarcina sp. BuS5]|uniref:hypothetical protein n=1 Tax=Desulfosarcina sp. BuS5 TaxID=933262 RepID=UPI002378A237|nr:hypothetical protein [Desulfosarcina sp. BuS5]WDN91004.1 hypothetical protein BuS5_03976 [Desulfosarcina sp. BuS5]